MNVFKIFREVVTRSSKHFWNLLNQDQQEIVRKTPITLGESGKKVSQLSIYQTRHLGRGNDWLITRKYKQAPRPFSRVVRSSSFLESNATQSLSYFCVRDVIQLKEHVTWWTCTVSTWVLKRAFLPFRPRGLLSPRRPESLAKFCGIWSKKKSLSLRTSLFSSQSNVWCALSA